jgi:uncharacterized phage protein (TIGR02218 family)
MTSFDTLERSVQDSVPIEIYKVSIGTDVYTWTSCEDTITYDDGGGDEDYEPVAVSRGNIVIDPNDRRNAMVVTVPGDNDFVTQYLNQAPAAKATVVITRLQRNESPAFDTAVCVYRGIVASVGFPDNGLTAQIALQTEEAANDRQIPRFTFMGSCNNILFDSRCGVNPATFTVSGTVSTYSLNTVTVPGLNAKPDGYFNGGFVKLGSGVDHRLILAHTGNVLTLLLPFSSDPTGVSVDAFAGCDHTLTGDCATKFDNVLNFGGFAFVPSLNPFQSNPWTSGGV